MNDTPRAEGERTIGAVDLSAMAGHLRMLSRLVPRGQSREPKQ